MGCRTFDLSNPYTSLGIVSFTKENALFVASAAAENAMNQSTKAWRAGQAFGLQTPRTCRVIKHIMAFTSTCL